MAVPREHVKYAVECNFRRMRLFHSYKATGKKLTNGWKNKGSYSSRPKLSSLVETSCKSAMLEYVPWYSPSIKYIGAGHVISVSHVLDEPGGTTAGSNSSASA